MHGIGIWQDAKTVTKKQGEWNEGRRVKWLNRPIKTAGENYNPLSSKGF